ncbi:unnamed protein product, partial [Iphiclides podalirius]
MQRTPSKDKTYGSEPNVANLQERRPTMDNWINVRQKKKRIDEDSDSDSSRNRECRRQRTSCCNHEDINKTLVLLSEQMSSLTSLLNTFKNEQNSRFYELKNEINDIKKGNAEIEKSLDYLGGKYMEMEKCLKERKEEVMKQENRVKEIIHKNVYLEKCNKALEERLMRLEQKELELQIELQNVEKQEGENLLGIVYKIAEELRLETKDIAKVWRVPGDSIKAPRPIIVSLNSREARIKWLKSRKDNITNHVILNNNNNSRIYVNEHVTRQIRQLFWSAKNKLKENFKFIWIQNGKILIKKSEIEKKIYQISFESDIEEILHKKKE